MGQQALEWVEAIGGIVLSWPVAGLIGILVLRKPITQILSRFGGDDVRKLRAGSFEIERVAEQGQQALTTLNRINRIMAESRKLELEIVLGVGFGFTAEQREQMSAHIEQLRQLLQQLDAEEEARAADNTLA